MTARVFLFDVETTGADDGAEIIEAAIGEVTMPAAGGVLDMPAVTVSRFKPSRPIDLGAMEAHHILESDLVDCPPSSTFALPPETNLLVGHNIDFDWKMAGSPAIHRICTLALARSVWPALDSYKLGALLYHVLPHDAARKKLTTAHNAETDVRNLFIVLSELCRILKPESWRHLYKLSEDARIPKFITFGKHKPKPGEPPVPFDTVPRSYCEWILREADMDPYVKIAARRALGMAEPAASEAHV